MTADIVEEITNGKNWTDKTFIISTNNMRFLEYVDRILYLENGRIHFNGDYNQFSQHPRFSSFTNKEDKDVIIELEEEEDNYEVKKFSLIFFKANGTFAKMLETPNIETRKRKTTEIYHEKRMSGKIKTNSSNLQLLRPRRQARRFTQIFNFRPNFETNGRNSIRDHDFLVSIRHDLLNLQTDFDRLGLVLRFLHAQREWSQVFDFTWDF